LDILSKNKVTFVPPFSQDGNKETFTDGDFSGARLRISAVYSEMEPSLKTTI